MGRLRTLLTDTRASSTLEFGLMLMVYVAILFGLLVVNEMGLLTKRMQTESRVVAWNSLCPEEADYGSIKARLESKHHGTLLSASATLQPADPASVTVADNSSEEAVAVLSTVIRRMEGYLAFDFAPPWKLGYAGEDLEDRWLVERRHVVDTRTNLMYFPQRIEDVDPPPPLGGGGRNPPPPSNFTP